MSGSLAIRLRDHLAKRPTFSAPPPAPEPPGPPPPVILLPPPGPTPPPRAPRRPPLPLVPHHVDKTPDPAEPYPAARVREKLLALDALPEPARPFYITDHAVRQMEERSVSEELLFQVLLGGTVHEEKTYLHKGYYRYRLVGSSNTAVALAFGRSLGRRGPQDMAVILTVWGLREMTRYDMCRVRGLR